MATAAAAIDAHEKGKGHPALSSFFLLPSSFFLLPSSFFLLPSSFFLLPSSFFLLPAQGRAQPKRKPGKPAAPICRNDPPKTSAGLPAVRPGQRQARTIEAARPSRDAIPSEAASSVLERSSLLTRRDSDKPCRRAAKPPPAAGCQRVEDRPAASPIRGIPAASSPRHHRFRSKSVPWSRA